MVGPLPAWDAAFAHAAGLGFDGVLLPPIGAPGGSGHLFQLGDPDRPHPALEADGRYGGGARRPWPRRRAALAWRSTSTSCWTARRAMGGWWRSIRSGSRRRQSDAPPRPAAGAGGAAASGPARLADEGVAVGARRLVGRRGSAPMPRRAWRGSAATRRRACRPRSGGASPPRCRSAASWPGPPGLPARDLRLLAGAGFAATFNSLAWWDGREGWYAEEAFRLAAVAPAISTVESPFGPRLASVDEDPALAERAGAAAPAPGRRHRRRAAGADGLRVRRAPAARSGAGAAGGLAGAAAPGRSSTCRTRCARRMRGWRPSRRGPSELRPLSGPGAPVTALLRADAADVRRATRARGSCWRIPTGSARPRCGWRRCWPGAAGFARFRPLLPDDGRGAGAGQRGAARTRRGAAVRGRGAAPGAAPGRGAEAASRRRAAGGGRGRARRARAAHRDRGRGAGRGWRALRGEARGGRDRRGHRRPDLRRAREAGRGPPVARGGRDGRGRRRGWSRSATTAGPPRFPLLRMGRYVFVVEAWRDAFATFLDEITKKHAAGVPIALELEEGRLLVAAAAERAGGELAAVASRLKNAVEAERLAVLTAPETAALMAAGRRPALPRAQPRDAAWRRSGSARASRAGTRCSRAARAASTERHGTFRDVIAKLPRVRAMGFDVLYFTPIHPIGTRLPQGAQQHPDAGAGRSRQPLRHRQPGGRARRAASGARHLRGLPGAARGGGGARAGTGARLRHPVQPGPSLAPRAQGLVRLAAGRLAPLRREPAEEVPGHRQRRFLQGGRGALALDRAPRRGAVLVRAGRQAVPRGQPAHQALPVLGVDDRRHPRPLPGRGVPGRGLHPAEDHGPARQDRLLAVLHLLHLAEREAGDPAST